MSPRARLAPEHGFAVPIALTVMLTTLLLATAATSVAINTSLFSSGDTAGKTALEAADTGLHAALYRLNMLRPDANDQTGQSCPTVPITTVGSAGAPTPTLCPTDGPESIGNGAAFKYWISRVMKTGDICAGSTMASTAKAISQRCITALGSKNNSQVRLQERVTAYTSEPVFPTTIFGTKSVSIANNVSIASNVPATPALLGTNGTLTVGGGTTLIDGYQLPPNATVSLGNGVTNAGPTTAISSPYPIPTAINPMSTSQNTSSPFDTSTSFQGGTCTEPTTWAGTWVQTNCDYRITRGGLYPSCLSGFTTVPDCDPSGTKGTVSFNPVGRTLTLGNNSSLTLGGGYYNFCSLSLGNNSTLNIATGAHVSIFIDSPSDPNSGAVGSLTNPPCAATTGTFTMSQNSTLTATSALQAQIYVFGDTGHTPPQNTVSLQNNGSSTFSLVAPFSNVNVSPSNNTTFTGAIVGYTVTLGQASHFTYEADTSTLQTGSLELYYPTFWKQCPALSTSTTDPTAGC